MLLVEDADTDSINKVTLSGAMLPLRSLFLPLREWWL